MARGHPQRSVADQLIPHNVREANDARRRARRDRGVDSYEETVGNGNEEKFCTLYLTYEDDHDRRRLPITATTTTADHG